MRVVLAWSAEAGQAREITLELADGATALDALRAGAELADGPGPAASRSDAGLGIWGRMCMPETVLGAGDRLEIYRPLILPAAEARRLRATRRTVRGR